MKVNKVDHICIAVKDLDEARKVWEPVLGKSKPDDEYISFQLGEDEVGPGKSTADGDRLVWHFAAEKVNDFAFGLISPLQADH